MLETLEKIKTILDGISSSILPFKFSYLETQPQSFPAGMVLCQGMSEEIYDQANNIVTETFVVKLVWPQTESEVGYQKWISLTDAVNAEMRKKIHQTLDDTVISFMVKQALAPEFTDQYIQPVTVSGIILEVRKLKLIN